MPGPPSPAGSGIVFFLSDYGLDDEFVGVVHAVVARTGPGCRVVDLTHGVPPFDVRAGAATLARAVPHLGPGVVLAVVDPGVGGPRRNVVLEVGADPRLLVGPDNGLLLAAAAELGGVRRAFELHPGDRGSATTFDGRDVLGPAAALLATGGDPASLGAPVAPASLATVPAPVVEVGTGAAGQPRLRAEVTWVDRFGNVQLAARPEDLWPGGAPVPDGVPVLVVLGDGPARPARRVTAFSALDPGELGLLVDGNGRLALVLAESSAAAVLGASRGDLVILEG